LKFHGVEIEAELGLLFIPFGIGMVVAFFVAKKFVQRESYEEDKSMPSTLYCGCFSGYLASIVSAGLLLFVLGYFFEDRLLVEVFSSVLGGMVLYSVVSFVIGALIYIPCAFMGYGIGARKRAELEMEEKRQRVLKEMVSSECEE